MEDDKIKDLFAGFEPKIGSDSRFMDRLQARLDAVEEVKKQFAAERARNRKSLIVAIVVGFLAGFLFCQLLPSLRPILPATFQPAVWLAIAAGASLLATNAYTLTSSLLKR